MNNPKFSIVVSTNRGIKELNPLFVNTDDESELIIIDSNYNEETKKYLNTKIGKYKSIIYAPVLSIDRRYNRDFSRGLNTALTYAENDWIIKADDNLEFKSNFFEIAREDIKVFEETYNNQNFAIIGNKLWGQLKQEKWNDYNNTNGQRYIDVVNPQATFSFGIIPIDLFYTLNGYLELYDMGWGFDDIDFLHRALVLGCKVNFDIELMAFSYPHKSNRLSLSVNSFLYDIQKLEISVGKITAFNPYNIRNLQNKMLATKDDYIIE